MAKSNKLNKIEDQIQKLMQEKQQLLENQQIKIGKHIMKEWGEISMTENVFELITDMKKYVYTETGENASLTVDAQVNYNTGNTENDEQQQ